MAKKEHGCLVNLLSAIVLIGLIVWGINSCVERSNQARRAEEQRRSALTPEQRAEEDRNKGEEQAKAKAEQELSTRQINAELVSQKYVREFLKHPDDASFGTWDVPDIKWNEEQDTFYVSSKVKAKNDFGALLTYRWQTIVMLDSPENNAWKLVSCAIDGETVYESKELMEKLKNKRQQPAVVPGAATQRTGVSTQRNLTATNRLDLSGLATNPATWPKEVVLTAPVTFSNRFGESMLPRGMVVKVLSIQTNGAWLVWRDATNLVSFGNIDLGTHVTESGTQ